MQNNQESEDENPWLGVIGRSLAFLCLKEAGLREENIATQARFLETLGLSRKEAAQLLGTSGASLRVLLHVASKRKKKNGSEKKKPR